MSFKDLDRKLNEVFDSIVPVDERHRERLALMRERFAESDRKTEQRVQEQLAAVERMADNSGSEEIKGLADESAKMRIDMYSSMKDLFEEQTLVLKEISGA